MAYFTALTLNEALSALAAGPATIVAGATDVYPAHGEGRLAGPVVDIARIEDLRAITIEASGETVIGCAATWADVIRAPLPPVFDGLKDAAREVGAIQIQSRATVAGNLCTASPAGDGIPCLMALDTRVDLVHADGRRTLPLADFILGARRTALQPGEILTAIRVPAHGPRTRASFIKLGARHSLVISIAMASAILTLAEDATIVDARVCVGACSPVAVRLKELERALVGRPSHNAPATVAPQHMERLSPISDVRGPANYRREAAAELVRRALARCAIPAVVAAA